MTRAEHWCRTNHDPGLIRFVREVQADAYAQGFADARETALTVVLTAENLINARDRIREMKPKEPA